MRFYPRDIRTVVLWEPGDPTPPRRCRVCGRGFWHEGRGRPYVTCSNACHLADVRRQAREEYYRRVARQGQAA